MSDVYRIFDHIHTPAEVLGVVKKHLPEGFELQSYGKRVDPENLSYHVWRVRNTTTSEWDIVAIHWPHLACLEIRSDWTWQVSDATSGDRSALIEAQYALQGYCADHLERVI